MHPCRQVHPVAFWRGCTEGTGSHFVCRMAEALDSYVVGGLARTNINFLRDLMTHPKYVCGDFTTKFIEDEFPEGYKGLVLVLAWRSAQMLYGAPASPVGGKDWGNPPSPPEGGEGAGHGGSGNLRSVASGGCRCTSQGVCDKRRRPNKREPAPQQEGPHSISGQPHVLRIWAQCRCPWTGAVGRTGLSARGGGGGLSGAVHRGTHTTRNPHETPTHTPTHPHPHGVRRSSAQRRQSTDRQNNSGGGGGAQHKTEAGPSGRGARLAGQCTCGVHCRWGHTGRGRGADPEVCDAAPQEECTAASALHCSGGPRHVVWGGGSSKQSDEGKAPL